MKTFFFAFSLFFIAVFGLFSACATDRTDGGVKPPQFAAVPPATPPTAKTDTDATDTDAPELENEAQLGKPPTAIDPHAPVPPNAYPSAKLTTGDTFPAATVKQICVAGYSATVRNVPQSVKDRVYRNYQIKTHRPGDYEIDHLISLELGGSNSIKNLWAQSYSAPNWNAHSKDDLENRLHALVCADKISLIQAQTEIKTDWIRAYKKYFP